jgi:hypothetical protein
MARGKRIASPPETLQVAVSLAAAGWHVFPVTIYADDDPAKDKRHKVPAVPRGTSWKDWATDDVEAVATAWAGDSSGCWIGVYAGRSGIVVLDLDKSPADGAKSLKAAGLTVPSTFHYKTLGGGTHHVYAAPEGRDLTNAQPMTHRGADVLGADVRAGDGLMVYYGPELESRPALAPAPVWLLVDRVRTSAGKGTSVGVDAWLKRVGDGKPSKATRRYVSAAEFPEGTAHDAMLDVVGHLVRAGANGEPVAGLIAATRARYIDGKADRVRDWDNALAGSVDYFGLPPVTFEPDARTMVEPRPVRRIDKATRRKALRKAQRATRRWFGDEYDLDVQLIMWAAAAVEQLDGDPVWLLIVGGPGGAKTESGMALLGIGARVVSSIASIGSLLSATSKGERTNDATGGLLREMGDRGLLFIKDFTSIMSQNSNTRAEVLAALREIYDGQWIRDVGTDGGRSLEWKGRLSVIGAVTTAWDSHQTVVAAMGDRFALVRIDSSVGRMSAGRQALSNVGSESAMREELAKATGAVLGNVDGTRPPSLKRRDEDAILAAAELVTRARTAVENDYQGNPVDSHAPEAPTRFAKQVGQIMRGALAIGVKRDKALRLAIRSARDSMPPLRLSVLEDIAANPGSSTANVVKRLQKPRATIDRTLQALHLLGLVIVDEEPYMRGDIEKVSWRYSLAQDVYLDALSTEPHAPFITNH